MLLWGLTGGLVGFCTRSLWRFVLYSICGLLLLGLLVYSAFLLGWWLPVVPSALIWLLAATLVTVYVSNQQGAQHALLTQLVSWYVSPEVGEMVWRRREHVLQHGRFYPQRSVASVLVAEMVGVAPEAEKVSPQAVLEWMNEYIAVIVQQIVEHGGVVNMSIGDSVLTIFGAPLVRRSAAEMPQDAVRAVQCALAMKRALKPHNQHRREHGLPTTGLCVGICTGTLVAGSLESFQRPAYTVMGDIVHRARQLAHLTSPALTSDPDNDRDHILVDESTARHLDHQFHLQRVEEVRLKGQASNVTIYVVGSEDQSSEQQP